MVTEEARRVLERLPDLIREDEFFRLKLWQVLNAEFTTKAEFSRVLEEIQKSRDEADRRFEAADLRFESLLQELREVRSDTNRRFDEVDKKFVQVDQRLDGVDQRLDGVDQRLDGVDQRLEGIDQRLEGIDQRFDGVDQRFDGVDQRFDDQASWVGVVVGGFQRRAGRSLEDAIAGTLRVALRMKNVDPGKIKLRQKIADVKGAIGPAGRDYEVDIVVTNGESWIFEVKSVAEVRDVLHFNDVAELAIATLPLPGARKALITLDKPDDVIQLCQRLGIVLG